MESITVANVSSLYLESMKSNFASYKVVPIISKLKNMATTNKSIFSILLII
ncbi:hypothetical protein SALWKB2_1508 [Snodgrassella alvi wkB2]|nr:hypothetical protein SALWKB2_1508 [Snodgrassella alvi wkB2]